MPVASRHLAIELDRSLRCARAPHVRPAACVRVRTGDEWNMDSSGSLTLFHVHGIPVRAHWTLFFAIPYLVLSGCSDLRRSNAP